MKAVVQRVESARVDVGGETVGRVGRGFLVLLGVGREDGPADGAWLAKKIVGLRVFEDDAGKMNLALSDIGGEVLVVSQFTLWGDCGKGRRPSFVKAAPPDQAEALYEAFIQEIKDLGVPTASGRFGAMMAVHLVNDGPVTLIVETPGKEGA